MAMRKTLKDFGYPQEGIIYVDSGGGNGYECPQEALSAHTCGSCKKFNRKEWICMKDNADKEPDEDFCDDIDYAEEWLDSQYGFRSPVRCEYSSDDTYEQACKAIDRINTSISDQWR